MYWIFNYLQKVGIDPIKDGVVNITSTPMRSSSAFPKISANYLVIWDGFGMYTIEKENASVFFNFAKIPFIKQYKLLSRGDDDCSPSGHVLEGSNDGKKYNSIHIFPYSLCGGSTCSQKTERKFDLNLTYSYKYYRIVQYKGECDSTFLYFGLTSVDFYGSFLPITWQKTSINLRSPLFSVFVFLKK